MSRYTLVGPEREANYLNGTPHLTWLLRSSDGREWVISLRHDLARAELMHKRTAEHLREERRRRRAAEADLADAEDHLRMWLGPETGYSIQRTPEHYRGDGFVTCARAMESAAAQETVCERPPMALWWWLCALKYVWRMGARRTRGATVRRPSTASGRH